MDDKQISKKHQEIIKKNIDEALKYHDKRIKELENDKNRIQKYQKNVEAYNKAKFKEYNEILEALKNSSKDYYQYYKQYEKKHGWQKTTQLLEKRNFMNKWVNYVPLPLIKYIKPSRPLQFKDVVELPPTPPDLSVPDHIFNPEDQYINEEDILDNLKRDIPREYLSYRMSRAGFFDSDIERTLEMLTDAQIYQIVDEIQRLLPMDETTKRKLKSPPNDDHENDIDEDTQSYEYVKIMEILTNYGVFL